MIYGYQWSFGSSESYEIERFTQLKDAVAWGLAAPADSVRKLFRMPAKWQIPNVVKRKEWRGSFSPPKSDDTAKIYFIEEHGCPVTLDLWRHPAKPTKPPPRKSRSPTSER